MSKHTHDVTALVDDDIHFIVDPITREITYDSETPLVIMQKDNNSEKITFEVPRIVDGHDMASSNEIEVHFTNTGVEGESKSYRKIPSTDVKEKNTDPSTLELVWTIPDEATLFVGQLYFALKFRCTETSVQEKEDENGNPFEVEITKNTYVWNTKRYPGIPIIEGLDNEEAVQVDSYDHIANQFSTIANDKIVDINAAANRAETAITEQEQASVAVVEKTIIQSVEDGLIQNSINFIKTINGVLLKFFCGTQAAYEALTAEQKQNLYALITDDKSADDIIEVLDGICSGNIEVPNANRAAHADKARDDILGNSFTDKYFGVYQPHLEFTYDSSRYGYVNVPLGGRFFEVYMRVTRGGDTTLYNHGVVYIDGTTSTVCTVKNSADYYITFHSSVSSEDLLYGSTYDIKVYKDNAPVHSDYIKVYMIPLLYNETVTDEIQEV